MTNQTLQTACQIILAIGIFLSAIGGLGAYIYGNRVLQEKEAKQTYVGRLETEQKLILSKGKNIYPEIELGDSGAIFKYTGPKGSPLFKIAGDNDITIEVDSGQIKVSTKIRGQNGQMVAEILKNEWKVNPNNSWDRNYSKNALEVRDSIGDVVLQVRLVQGRVQFQAKLYDSTGKGIAFGKGQRPGGQIGGLIEQTGPGRPKLTMKIQPIFKYPSSLHLGELIDIK